MGYEFRSQALHFEWKLLSFCSSFSEEHPITNEQINQMNKGYFLLTNKFHATMTKENFNNLIRKINIIIKKILVSGILTHVWWTNARICVWTENDNDCMMSLMIWSYVTWKLWKSLVEKLTETWIVNCGTSMIEL